MARRWTQNEEKLYRTELYQLYVVENKSIGEIAALLLIGESTVFQRLLRLGIPSNPSRKVRYLHRKKGVTLPTVRTPILAELFGILLGDGHISHSQTIVTLGTKELRYVEYVANLMQSIFHTPATICIRKDGYRDVYIGSVQITSWLKREGLVQNKVAAQVDAPVWIFDKPEYMQRFLRGFFDTDGSIYRLRFGMQISLTNRSAPLLRSLQRMLIELGYRPSAVSFDRVYITRRNEVFRFFEEIQPANTKHLRRFVHISNT